MPERVLFSWSGGKDSALALRELLAGGEFEIAALLTTVTADYDRISMHGVRRVLLEKQANSLGFPLEIVSITKNSSNEEYEANMRRVLTKHLASGVSSVAIGDVFLEDVRQYRENNLAKIGMRGIFPLWRRDTRKLVHTFVDLGFEAIVTCVDSKVLDKRFVGRLFDVQLLLDLPSTVDPCGENGEYHSFVYDGPIFRNKVEHTVGEVVLRDNRFYYCELVPR